METSGKRPTLLILMLIACFQIRVASTRPINLVTGVFTPIMLLSLLIFPEIHQMTSTRLTEVMIGTMLASFWAASIWGGMGIIRNERMLGTFAKSMVAVLDPRGILLGKILGASFLDTFQIMVTTGAFVLLVPGLDPSLGSPTLMVIGILLTLFSGIAWSFMIGTVLIITRYGFQIAQIIGAPMLLLGGTIISPDNLPGWISWVPALISLSWIKEFVVSASINHFAALPLIVAVSLSCVYLILGLKFFSALSRKARTDGSIEL